MENTFLFVLAVFSLHIPLYCGQTQDAVLTMKPNWSTLFTGESVTFQCDMREGKDSDWYYSLTINGHEFRRPTSNKEYTWQPSAAGYSGDYQCFGEHKNTHRIKESNKVSLTVTESDVILERPSSVFYRGESVILHCRHRDNRQKTVSFFKDASLLESDTDSGFLISQNTVQINTELLSDQSSFTCRFDGGKTSEAIKVKVEGRPKATLSKGQTYVPAGGNVTLKCSVMSPSSDWKYFWYRGRKTTEPMTAQHVAFLSNQTVSVPQGGLYWCRGGRGNPVYYTNYSDPVVTSRAVVALQPSWQEVYEGESITLRCDIENVDNTEWEFEWLLFTTSTYQGYTSDVISRQREHKITNMSASHGGDYRCIGRMKNGPSTSWSGALTLKVSNKKPKPVLTVSPVWLSPGDSVTLSCSVKDQSAGWTFYWYNAIPPASSSSSELLTSRGNGSYTVHGQTHTAGFTCRAGRGHPIYYTHDSKPTYVWSGDVDSAASLTVSPDRVQHLKEEPVSLSCGRNSTKWTIKRFWTSSTGSSHIWTTNGPTLNKSDWLSGVYWCESEAGQLSNAVNITGYHSDIIMVSPAHPVAEGKSVTLGCKMKTKIVHSNVKFYKNGELILNSSGDELFISAVSKSDEGFYKCEGRDSQGQIWVSEESWMSITSVTSSVSRPRSGPLPVLLICTLAAGSLFIILLLLFLIYLKRSRESCFIRSQSTKQGSTKDHMINQNGTIHKYLDSAQDDECSEVTYALVSLQHKKKSRPAEAEETVYSEVKV